MNILGWQWRCLGWPWWVVLPLGGLIVVLLWRLQRREWSGQPTRVANGLRWLRTLTAAALVLSLLEPTLTHTRRVSESPLVALLVDQSGSMEVHDRTMSPTRRLSEAVALGLIPAQERRLLSNAVQQAEADRALVASARPDSAVGRGLQQLAEKTRLERAWTVAQKTLEPQLRARARVRVFGYDTALVPLDLHQESPAAGHQPTDPEAALRVLSKDWAQEHVGAIVLLSDGRQTAGQDASYLARAWRARGAWLGALMVGDPESPSDAMVGELSGSSDVFVDESIFLEAQYRVVGASGRAWELVLNRDGEEIQRRPVQPTGNWQTERFEVPAHEAGMVLFQVRLEASGSSATARPIPGRAGRVQLETWRSVRRADWQEAHRVARLRKPDRIESLSQLASPQNVGDSFAARIRGWLIPPAAGSYVFYLSADDAAELWLSRSGRPREAVKIIAVEQATHPFAWEEKSSQQSAPQVLATAEPVYFEVWQRDGTGDDHVEVGWQLPNRQMERPIPGRRLAAFEDGATSEMRTGHAASTNTWEEASLSNNSAEFAVNVNRDPIRVFLADASPRWESRYLTAMFERDRRMRLIRRYHSIVASLPQEPFLPRTQAEWDQFDMVVLGDLDSAELRPEQQQQLADYVSRRGGFLMALAGPRGMPRSFSLSPLLEALPVKVANHGAEDAAAVALELTEAGREHVVTQVLRDPSLNERLWPALPPLQWLAGSVVAKPAATVLLQAQNAVRTPVVAVQRFGAGRSLWMGTSESWRWRDRLGDRVHQTFWLQAVRWGLAGRLRGQDARLQVGLDRYAFAPGEAVELRARATLSDGRPAGQAPHLIWQRLDEAGQVVAASSREADFLAVADSPDTWQITLPNLDLGHWRLTVSCPHPELRSLKETRDLSVREVIGREGLELSADGPALTHLAEAGGYVAGGLEHAEAMAKDLAGRLRPRVREQVFTLSLWDNYFALLLVVGCLCVEWVWRKRRGLP